MKKIFIYLMTVLMIFGIVTVNTKINIKAEDVNSCAAFEVDWINDDGTFVYAGCKDSLDEAKLLMNSDPLLKGDNGRNDYVIRHSSSKSSSKIIAMQSGIAYSFPYRSNNSDGVCLTLAVFQYPDKNNVSDDKDARNPHITGFEEMKYFETLSYNPDTKTGDALVLCYGFEGYARIDDIDLVPSKYLRNGLKIALGGNTYNGYSSSYISSSPVNIIPSKNYYTVEKSTKGNYLDLVYHYYSYGSRSGEKLGHYKYAIGKPAAFMQEGVKYYSSDGVNFYTDLDEITSFVGTYYNYFQYVPLRATSNIDASVFDKFLESKGANASNSELYGTGQLFLEAEKKYGINAIMMFGIACNETAYGRSVIKKSGDNGIYSTHNLFNTNAVDTNPKLADVFDSVEQCINQTASYWFGSFIDLKDPRFYGSHLGNKGSGINVRYATDPLWGIKAAANAYAIDKLANDYNGKLSNADKDTLGVITTFNANLYKEADTNSTVYKQAYYGYTYMKDFTVIIKDVADSFYKVVSTNPISENRENMLMYLDIQRDTPYNRDSSYYYVKKEDIRQVSNLTVEASGPYTGSVSEIRLNESGLVIKGSAYTPGVIVPASAIKTTLETYKGSLYGKTYNAVQNINGDVVNFEFDIPLEDLGYGTYSFKIFTGYSGYSKFNGSFNAVYNSLIDLKTIGDKVYKFVYSNDLTRLEVKAIDSEALSIRGGINSFEINNTTLSIDGIAYFDNVSFDSKNDISHKLIFDDLNSEYTKTYDLETYEFNLPSDKYTYRYIGFRGDVNLSDIPSGDYKVFVEIKNGNKQKTFALYLDSKQLKTGNTGSRKYTIQAIRSKGYRVELSLADKVLDFSSVKVPTDFMSRYMMDDISINGNILTLHEPCSFIRYIDYKSSSKVNFSVILTNIITGKTYTYNFGNKACEFNYDALNVFDNLVNYGCFDSGNIDLSNVENGTYAIYVKNTNSPYTDIFNMYSYEDVNIKDGPYSVFTNDISNLYLKVNRGN